MTDLTPRRLGLTFDAIAHAIRLTADQGPHVGMEYLADYLNAIDANDESDNDVPEDWNTRWFVTRRTVTEQTRDELAEVVAEAQFEHDWPGYDWPEFNADVVEEYREAAEVGVDALLAHLADQQAQPTEASYDQRCDTTDNGRQCLHHAGHGDDHRYAQPRKAQT